MAHSEFNKRETDLRVDEHVRADAQRWKMMAWSIIVAFVLIGVLAFAGLVLLNKTRNNAAKVSEFCDLVINVHNDRINRYESTVTYLRSPESKETPGLNQYIIKISLPQSLAEIVKERGNLPKTCTQNRKLPEVPQPFTQ